MSAADDYIADVLTDNPRGFWPYAPVSTTLPDARPSNGTDLQIAGLLPSVITGPGSGQALQWTSGSYGWGLSVASSIPQALECWALVDNQDDKNYKVFMQCANTPNGAGAYLALNLTYPGKLAGYAYGASNPRYIYSAVSPWTWQHLVVTTTPSGFSGSTKFYLNGVLVGSDVGVDGGFTRSLMIGQTAVKVAFPALYYSSLPTPDRIAEHAAHFQNQQLPGAWGTI